MKIKEFDRRVAKAIEKEKKKIKLRIRRYQAYSKKDLANNPEDAYYSDHVVKLKEQLKHPDPFELQLRKRTRYFQNYKDSCGLDLINETGHSYRWWSMFKRIKGQLVLNTYRYSNCTSKHINKTRQVLDALEVKYINIPSPKGLQDLDSAKYYAIFEVASFVVKNKYARKKIKYNWKTDQLILNLKKVGIVVKQKDVDDAVLRCEKSRTDRLERQRNEVRVVTAKDSDAHKPGLHIEINGYVSSYTKRKYKQDAEAKGFKRVYLHESGLTQRLFGHKLENIVKH